MNNNIPAAGRKIAGLFFLVIIAAVAHAQTGNPPPLSAANTTNSDRAVLINSNYDGTATSANEFIYFRSGAANRNDLVQANSWYNNSQLVVADAMVATFRKSGSGGVFKLNNRSTEAGNRWWLGFGNGEDFSDGHDMARIGVDNESTSVGSLFFTTGGEAAGGHQLERMRISSDGNVGIGTQNPHAALHFGNVSTNRRIVFWEDYNNENQFYGFGLNASQLRYQVSSTTADHVFYAGSAATTSNELLRIKGNGNVGIGTDSPAFKLDVNGSAKVNSLQTNTIVASENVGIGTASPAEKLDINGNLKLSGVLRLANTLNNRKIVLYEVNPNNQQYLGFGVNADMLRYQVGSPTDNHVFYACNSDLVSSKELMRITGAGRVGIGTSSPASSLDVNGTARVNKFIVGTGPDLSIIADGGKQSVISSWNTLQLVGNRGAAVDYTPANTGSLNEASVIIPNQQADKIGLLVQGKASQAGNLLEFRNAAGTKLSSFSADGRLCIQCGPSFTSATTLLELGVDNSGITTQLLRVHGGATFNNELAPDELTQVSINTNFRVDSAALTVAGPAYIGSWQTAQANPKKDYLKKYMLWVEKGIVTEDVAYAPKADWADYVFSNDYQLIPLTDLKAYLQQHRHLPGVKSAEEVAANGYSNHEFNKTILAKVEELALYIIEQDKKTKELTLHIAEQDKQIAGLILEMKECKK